MRELGDRGEHEEEPPAEVRRSVVERSSTRGAGTVSRTVVDGRREIQKGAKLIDVGEAATHVARDLGMSRATLYLRLKYLSVRTGAGR